MKAKAISFTPEVLKAKLRALEEHGRCMTRRPVLPAPPSVDLVRGMSGSAFSIFTDRHTPGIFRVAGQVWAVRDLIGIEPTWRAPFGPDGQILWVRERARVLEYAHGASGPMVRLAYEVDGMVSLWMPYPARLKEPVVGRCIPNGVHREGARHFLEVVEVRVEMLHTTPEEDARLEGFASRDDFKRAWNMLYQKRAQRWLEGEREMSPWCWVYTLARATIPAGRT